LKASKGFQLFSSQYGVLIEDLVIHIKYVNNYNELGFLARGVKYMLLAKSQVFYPVEAGLYVVQPGTQL